MIREIEQLFSETILIQAAERFGVSLGDIQSVGGFESFVYEYMKDDKPYILKITNEIRRSVEQIMGELEWTNFLAVQGVPVCAPVLSARGNWVEVIEPERHLPHVDGPSRFLAISYKKASGHEATGDDWTEQLFYNLGRAIGKMHHTTKSYHVSDLKYRRQEWYEEEQLQARKYVSYDMEFVEHVESKIEFLRKVFQDAEAYGLIHSDVSPRNFHVTEQGAIQIFDFDDIGYHPFINDIAIAWFYALHYPPTEPSDVEEYVSQFIRHFLRGYREYREIGWGELRFVPEFMNIRHALNYIVFHQNNRPEDLPEGGRVMLRQHRDEVFNGMEMADIVLRVLEILEPDLA